MNAQQQTLARHCLDAAEADSLTFPQIVAALMAGGFESYSVDFRRAAAIYYLPDGDGIALEIHRTGAGIGASLDVLRLQAAIRQAQTQASGYSYRGFCRQAVAAGCAGYMVSFPGRRAVYFGRDGAVHTEYFPAAD